MQYQYHGTEICHRTLAIWSQMNQFFGTSYLIWHRLCIQARCYKPLIQSTFMFIVLILTALICYLIHCNCKHHWPNHIGIAHCSPVNHSMFNNTYKSSISQSKSWFMILTLIWSQTQTCLSVVERLWLCHHWSLCWYWSSSRSFDEHNINQVTYSMIIISVKINPVAN